MFQQVLFFLALTLFACTSAPAQTANVIHNPTPAHNVEIKTNRINAYFKDEVSFVIYLDGCGATALFDGRQFDFDCLVSETQEGEWSAVNSDTGDYVILNIQTGVVTSKVAGKCAFYLPTVEGTAGM